MVSIHTWELEIGYNIRGSHVKPTTPATGVEQQNGVAPIAPGGQIGDAGVCVGGGG